jgi:putative tributyrin esterase
MLSLCRAFTLSAFAMSAVSAQLLPRRGTVRTDTVRSQALGVVKQVVTYLPPSYGDSAARDQRYPVAVYLHGAWGSERDWTVQGRMAETLDSLIAIGLPELIVVMPDGDDGWWTTWHSLNDVAACRRTARKEDADTYCVPWPKYDDYVAVDVVRFADSTFRTIGTRASRGIAGLSMGGYGAISIAARYPDRFAAAASHSGVLRPALLTDSTLRTPDGGYVTRDARTPEEIRRAAAGLWTIMEPAFGRDSVSWITRDPARLIAHRVREGVSLPLFFADVGTGDYLLAQSRGFRDALRELGVPLVYAEWPGLHDWPYWRTHLPESVRFLTSHLVR